MSAARLGAGFCAGIFVGASLWSWAAPTPSLRPYEVFAAALAIVRDRYVEPLAEPRLLADAIAGMVHARDVHSVYLPPSRYARAQEDTEGELADPGLELGAELVESAAVPRVVVAKVILGSPAELAGLAAGDLVLAIDGQPTSTDAAGLKSAGRRLRGDAGTRLTLTVQRAAWRRPREVALLRAQRRPTTATFTALGPELGLLSIDRFAETTAHQAARALAAAERAQVRALVLDLRGNRGGVVDQALAVADLFLESGTLVTVVERGRRQRRLAHPGAFTGALVVLVDRYTASAAELVAAALAEHGRARLVGEPTFGKGSVQTYFPLADGGALRLTTGWYLTPNGNSLETKGIAPHVAVPSHDGAKPTRPMSSSQTPSARAANGATIAPGFDDDPQLVAAVAVARALLSEERDRRH